MATLIGPKPTGIVLHTAERTEIDNEQGQEISALELAHFRRTADRHDRARVRSDPCPRYNCHGLTILYYGSDGDVEHSGVVVSRPQANLLRIPEVVSKWGRGVEAVHPANVCPYSFGDVRYYRCKP